MLLRILRCCWPKSEDFGDRQDSLHQDLLTEASNHAVCGARSVECSEEAVLSMAVDLPGAATKQSTASVDDPTSLGDTVKTGDSDASKVILSIADDAANGSVSDFVMSKDSMTTTPSICSPQATPEAAALTAQQRNDRIQISTPTPPVSYPVQGSLLTPTTTMNTDCSNLPTPRSTNTSALKPPPVPPVDINALKQYAHEAAQVAKSEPGCPQHPTPRRDGSTTPRGASQNLLTPRGPVASVTGSTMTMGSVAESMTPREVDSLASRVSNDGTNSTSGDVASGGKSKKKKAGGKKKKGKARK